MGKWIDEIDGERGLLNGAISNRHVDNPQYWRREARKAVAGVTNLSPR